MKRGERRKMPIGQRKRWDTAVLLVIGLSYLLLYYPSRHGCKLQGSPASPIRRSVGLGLRFLSFELSPQSDDTMKR